MIKSDIEDKLCQLFTNFLFRASCRSRLLVLMYHRVLPEPDPMRSYEINAEVFKWQMQVLAKQFNVLSLSDALLLNSKGKLPGRSVCITFDDGYADNASIAVPILQKWGLNATFFIATGFLDGGCMWNDRVIEAVRHVRESSLNLKNYGLGNHSIGTMQERYNVAMQLLKKLKHLPFNERNDRVQAILDTVGEDLPNNLMMKTEDVRSVAASGMEIGAHTVNHPILTQIPIKTARNEIVESKAILEDMTRKHVRFFAYPNGRPNIDYERCHVDLVEKAGFEAALSTAGGVLRRGDDLYQIPRVSPWARTPGRLSLQLAKSYWTKPATIV